VIEERAVRDVVVGLYAWAAAVFFGAVLLDVAYSRAVPETAASADGRDLLLLVGGSALLVGLGAVAACWGSQPARTLVIASLVIASFELLVPPLVPQLVEGLAGSGAGGWVRLAIDGTASLLAFAGSYAFYRSAEERITAA
jgi:hypothetical protein